MNLVGGCRRTKKAFTCVVCGGSFQSKGMYVLRCPKCRPKANEERRRLCQKVWMEKNRERWNRYVRGWGKVKRHCAEYREKLSVMRKEWRKKNPQKARAIWKRARIKHHAAYAANNRKRLMLKKGVVGSHTTKQWGELKQKYLFRCACCKKRKTLTRDHIIPLSLGGSDFIDNIQPLCQSCNSAKGVKVCVYS